MPFAVGFSLPVTAAAAAAGTVLAAIAIRRYLSSSHQQRPASATTLAVAGKSPEDQQLLASAARSVGDEEGSSSHQQRPSSATTLVVAGKSPEDQQLLASAAKSVGDEVGGGEITVALASNAPVARKDMGFEVDAYMDTLRVRRFGRWMLWSPGLASTQDLVEQNFSKLPLGAVCVADVQFKGRGRKKNVWESPPGCLMFSFTSQMNDARKLPFLQYVVCISMTEAIKELCHARGLPKLGIRIKWPNDIYLNGLKVGGILCSSRYVSKLYNICIGIGLNVDNEKPTTSLNAILEAIMADSHRLKREDIMAYFFNKFEVLFEIFLNQGFEALEKQYYDSWLHSDQKIVIEDMHESESSYSVVTIQGLTRTGNLYAINQDGQTFELHPDDNSVDFFIGLVKRKMYE